MKRFPWIQPLHLLLLVAVVASLYGASLQNGFVWDDHQIIAQNPNLTDIRLMPQMLISEDTFPGLTTGYYRPITYLSFFIDWSIWGDRPFGFTLTNILLHLLTSIALYRLARLLCSDARPALYAALIFAAHPVAAEAVNFHAGGRNTLLCTFFMVLAFASHLEDRRALALLCFGFALLAKEFALLLPLVLLFHDRIVAEKRLSLASYLPYGVCALAYLLLRSLVVSSNLLIELQVGKALATLPVIIATYLLNFIAPVNLKTLYTVGTDGLTLTWSICLLLLAAGAIYLLRNDRLILFAATMGMFLLLPVLNFVPIGVASMADRHAYPALTAFSLVLAWLLHRFGRQPTPWILAMLILAYGAITVQRSSIWRSDVALYSRMISDAPARGTGYQNLGMYYYNSGDEIRALQYLNEYYLRQDYNPEALFALAAISFETGNHAKAAAVLEKLDNLYPGNPQTHIILARIHEAAGDPGGAQAEFAKARTIFPDIDRLLAERAGLLCREGEQLLASTNHQKAEQKFKSALLLKPDFVPALLDLGIARASQGAQAEALTYFHQAVKLSPKNPAAHFNAALVYRDMGKVALAEREMTIFRQLSGK